MKGKANCTHQQIHGGDNRYRDRALVHSSSRITRGNSGSPQWLILTLCLAMSASVGASKLDDAAALQQSGKLREARDLYRTAAAEARVSGDQQNAITALSAAENISVSLGDYPGAISDAEQAIQLRRAVKMNSGFGFDFNTLGLAQKNLGNYPAALENYQEALRADRAEGDGAGEITRLREVRNLEIAPPRQLFFDQHW